MADYNDNAAVIIARAEPGLLIKIAKLVLKSEEHSFALTHQVDLLLRIRPCGFVDGTFFDEGYGHQPARSPSPAPPPGLPPAPPTGVTVDMDGLGGNQLSPSAISATEDKASRELKRLETGLLSWSPDRATVRDETEAAASEVALPYDRVSESVRGGPHGSVLDPQSSWSPARATARGETDGAVSAAVSEVALPYAGSVADQQRELKRLNKNYRARMARAAKKAASSEGMAAGVPAAPSTSKGAPRKRTTSKGAPRKRNMRRQCRRCREWVEADGDGSTCSCWDPAPDGDQPASRRRT